MKRVSIVGMGRFGKVWYRLLQGTFPVTLYSRGSLKLSEISLAPNTRIAKDLREVYESDTIFYAVPISSFERIIRSHRKYFSPRHINKFRLSPCHAYL
jgi:prephenate dehydrogenase